jgi:GNAT superfamily N-acetyltransferase
VAVRAGELEPYRLAAVAVGEDDRRPRWRGRVPVSPLHQGHHDVVEVPSLVGQPVLVAAALAAFLVGDLAQQSLADETGKPVAEDLPGRLGAPLHVTEPADTAEGLTQDEEGPLLTDEADRGADRAVGRVVVQFPGVSHTRMLDLFDRLSNPGDARSVNRTQVDAAAARIEIRQACGADRDAIRDFFAGLSLRTRYLRFFTGVQPVTDAMLRLLAGCGDHTDTVVATEDGAIIGHAMATDTTGPAGTHAVEIGVVVADARQGHGVGSALVRALAGRAQARGTAVILMEVLAENREMLAMITNHFPAAQHHHSGPYVAIHAPLPRSPEEQPGELPIICPAR